MYKIGHNKEIKRNGPVKNPGRFFLLCFSIFAQMLFSSCRVETNSQTNLVSNSQQALKIITLQNQMAPDFYAYILDKIKNNQPMGNLTKTWGVAIPHHQLAADVMAQTLFQLKDNDYENIIILSPDHFNRGTTQISFVESQLKTATGITQISKQDIDTLKTLDKTANGDGFIAFEHGVGTPIPFIVSLWPKANITPILVRGDAKKSDLTELLHFLETKSRQPKTLIIESSDFSHYLTPEAAHQKDLQTIEILKQDDPEKILNLHQPDNCDSINILYIMKKLQISEKARLDVYLNKNSQDYTKEKVTSSTSYLSFFISE